ncbi:hypothetical protein PUNSTDRAFT_131656 [Punctularia strigosozonata HHB-11173 SS5]|uniref:uncharacterized protein n=1 Tax=Punctularia strigosozonata (strain HHB-11173) TaxID=741275 RepID=UPI0004416FB9|nr:uncharacterized protein PUNSTDRAFT_131656 [Punctularia strigosozonata HHB-11173 SS5]EIN11491.1 hypothetical protein PUNSTDRAFT_131656 [Punctularia strigosozonata HHB-11173 SS5]
MALRPMPCSGAVGYGLSPSEIRELRVSFNCALRSAPCYALSLRTTFDPSAYGTAFKAYALPRHSLIWVKLSLNTSRRPGRHLASAQLLCLLNISVLVPLKNGVKSIRSRSMELATIVGLRRLVRLRLEEQYGGTTRDLTCDLGGIGSTQIPLNMSFQVASPVLGPPTAAWSITCMAGGVAAAVEGKGAPRAVTVGRPLTTALAVVIGFDHRCHSPTPGPPRTTMPTAVPVAAAFHLKDALWAGR